jgi:receptor protein-tyrosine kinase
MPQEARDHEENLELDDLSSRAVEASSSSRLRSNRLFSQSASLGFASGDVDSDDRAGHRRLVRGGSSGDLVSSEVVVLKEPMASTAADIRRLAQKLALHWFRGEDVRPALSVISAERGEGRTTIATNLACVYAQAGVRTLLVDADLHHPGVHSLFGFDFDDYDDRGALPFSGVENLSVISASKLFDVEYGKIMPTALSALLERQGSEFDVILVDTTAASVSDDYLFAGLSTGGAIVATREGKTKVKAAAKMLNSCEDAGVKIVGGIMLES